MIEYYVVYDKATGAIQWKSNGPEGSGAIQDVPENMGVLVMPYDAFLALPPGGQATSEQLAALKTYIAASINNAVGLLRCQYITDVPGQQATYVDKEAEARAWTADNAITLHYLNKEAEATGQTTAEVAALVIATADAWRVLNGKIEGARRGALVALDNATNIAAVISASVVNWTATISN